MFEKIMRLENISVVYGNKKILHNINFSIKRGEILVIAGESGSGKSTILKAIDGLLGNGGAIIDGQIFFGDNEITNLSEGGRRKISGAEIGMIFQNAGASFCPIRTIGEQIFESVQAHKNWTYENFWGRGITTEAVKRICKVAFMKFDIVRIFAITFEKNIASRRVLEKVGFTYESTIRDGISKNGEIQSYCMYSILRREVNF